MEIAFAQTIGPELIGQSQGQFKVIDIAAVMFVSIFSLGWIYKTVIDPWIRASGKGQSGSELTKDDLIGKETAAKAIDTVNRMSEMLEDSNTVILQKDMHGQFVLLNIPRFLEEISKNVSIFVDNVKEMVQSQRITEKHTLRMVNHQSDVLRQFAKTMVASKEEMEREKKKLDQLIVKMDHDVAS